MDLRHQKKYKIFTDESYPFSAETAPSKESWRYFELRGPYGALYGYHPDWLAVQVKAGIIGERTRRNHPEWKILQDADDLIVFKIKNSELEIGANIIKARKRKYLTDSHKDKLKKTWFQKKSTICRDTV